MHLDGQSLRGVVVFSVSFKIDNINIMKTYLYNFDPLKPNFYIVKLEFTGVNIIFFISTQKTCEAVLTSTHKLCFEKKYEK